MNTPQSPLVTTAWVEEHLDDPNVRLIEIAQKENGEIYAGGHLPGAVSWFWKQTCWHDTDREFVTSAQLATNLAREGIGADTTVVLYGEPVQYGCYAYWAFTMAGHRDLRLLDGSRTKWQAEDRPITTDVPANDPVTHEVTDGDASMRIGRDNVREHLEDPGRLLLDMRSPEEYSGERVMEYGNFDHGAERGGRIPGARHLFFRELLNEDDTFKSPAELQAAFDSVGATRDSNLEIVCYCRLSHRASLAWFALTVILDYESVKIYDGSWTEWGSIVGFPVEK